MNSPQLRQEPLQLQPGSRLYLDLMKGCLTRLIFGEKYRALVRPVVVGKRGRVLWKLHAWTDRFLRKRDLELVQRMHFDPAGCEEGVNWPADAETMIGLQRLENLEQCILTALAEDIPGDIIETGVWRGGAMIYALAVLRACGDTSRQVWLADSFQGLPKPDEKYAADRNDPHWTYNHFLGVSLEEVEANVRRYGLLDDRVHFLPGWFRDTLSQAPIEKLAIMRLDGDMYGSTIEALAALYPKLQKGGFCIIDDYGLSGCRRAVEDFRQQHGITDGFLPAGSSAVYWRRSGD